MRQKLGTSERQTCRTLGVARSTQRYQCIPRDDDSLRLALIRLAKQYGRYDYRKIIELLDSLEEKLVSLISKFGVKMSKDKAVTQKDELYGPSHKHKTESCHSQDDVDDILSQFGF